MKDEKSWLTCKEVAVLLNFTQRHIHNLINSGKLSAERDESGKFYINKSEFFRVYPETMSIRKPRNGAKSALKSTAKFPEEKGQETTKFLEEKVRHLQEMVAEKNRHNDFLVEQLSNFTQEKSKMLDAITSHTRLLEHKETSINKPFYWVWPFKKR